MRRGATATVLLCLCLPLAACSLRAGTFRLPPREQTTGSVQPSRVGVVVEKEFAPYTTTFRYWSTTPFNWSLHGLPEALVEALRPHFRSVELVSAGRSPSTDRHDLIARMSIDQLHFDGANTTGRRDRVDVTMTFVVERPDGAQVFRTTASGSGSSPYRQPCRFCKPDPREAYYYAFGAVFEQLSKTLSVADFRVVR